MTFSDAIRWKTRQNEPKEKTKTTRLRVSSPTRVGRTRGLRPIVSEIDHLRLFGEEIPEGRFQGEGKLDHLLYAVCNMQIWVSFHRFREDVTAKINGVC